MARMKVGMTQLDGRSRASKLGGGHSAGRNISDERVDHTIAKEPESHPRTEADSVRSLGPIAEIRKTATVAVWREVTRAIRLISDVHSL